MSKWESEPDLNGSLDFDEDFLSHAEKVKKFGVECLGNMGADGIKYFAGHWHVGGEYAHKLVIRNVTTSVRKLKYKLPKSRYFSMPYPDPIILSPGMSKAVEVIFRPVEYEPYDDYITIKVIEGETSGTFRVKVVAMIEKLVITSPYGLDLGYCPAFQTTVTSFLLNNTGEKDAPFKWDPPAPFIIAPLEGIIPVGKSQEITVTLVPTDASVFVSKAVCHIGIGVKDAIIENPLLYTKLSAISKYPHISLSETDVNFGDILCGTSPHDVTCTKEVILRNSSVVVAEFEVIRLENDIDEVFEISHRKGVIAPQSEITITINYTALAMGTLSIDTYLFRTPSNSSTTLTCRGMAVSPKVSLVKETRMTNAVFHEGAPENSLNFRDVELGNVETKVFILKNNSIKDVYFSVNDIDAAGGVFQVQPRQGIIPALTESFSVRVIFKPKKPINYYRRFFVLLNNCHPQYFDAYGTGYINANGEIKEQRPAPLRHAHIQAYKNRLLNGYGGIPSNELEKMIDLPNMKKEYFALVGLQGTRALTVADVAAPVARSGNIARTVAAPAEEMFLQQTDESCQLISISETLLDFGFTRYSTLSLQKTVKIKNGTSGKVSLVWSIATSQTVGVESGVEATNMSVSARRPSSVSAKMGERSVADTDFIVEPASTDINPGEVATFRVTFTPKQVNRNYVSKLEAYVFFKNQRTFNLVSDESLTPPWCVVLTAVGHTFDSGQLLANARIGGGAVRAGKLVFPSCFIGDNVFTTVVLSNTSNLPCCFTVSIGHDEHGFTATSGGNKYNNAMFFSAVPTTGVIEENSFAIICLRFSPTELRKYTEYINFLINGEHSVQTKLYVEGTGSVPFITCPSVTDKEVDTTVNVRRRRDSKLMFIPNGLQGTIYVKPTCVGLTTMKELVLKNGSRLPIQYAISIPEEAESILIITPMKGLIKGNESITIKMIFAPKEAVELKYSIFIRTYPVGGRSKRILDARQIGTTSSPELLQNLELKIILPGDRGCITYEPNVMDYDVRLVGTSDTKEMWIENISSVDLEYQIFYDTFYTVDKGEEYSTHKEPVQSGYKPIFKNNKDAIAKDKHSVSLNGDDFEHCLFSEYPTGILRARSKKRVLMTFLPHNAGKFYFELSAFVRTVDDSNNEQTTLKSNTDIATAIALQSQNHSQNSKIQSFAQFFTSVPLVATMSGRAAFPTLSFIDIRTHDTDNTFTPTVDCMWEKFSLHTLNKDLAVPPRDDELALYRKSSPDLTKLERYKFEFIPMIMGSTTQTVYLKIKNSGYLKTSFRLVLANEKTLDLEQWCTEEKPTKELNEIISIIEEIKCFEFEPKSADLYPGEECNLMISYNAKSLKYNGLHRLPVLMKIEQGKMFYLDLCGRTIPMNDKKTSVGQQSSVYFSAATSPMRKTSTANMPMGIANTVSVASFVEKPLITEDVASAATAMTSFLIVVPAASHNNVLHLKHITIGIPFEYVPLQRIQLYNPSSLAVKYQVSLDSINALNTKHYGKIIHICNPTGVIQALSVHYLEVYFHPINAKLYQLDLQINYEKSIVGMNLDELFASTKPVTNSSTAGTSRKSMRSRSKSPSAGSRMSKRSPSINSVTSLTKKVQPQSFEMDSPAQTLSLRVFAQGLDPRNSPPVIETLFSGQFPPTLQLVSLPGQLISTSTDLIDFGILPQLTTAHRFFLLENNSEKPVDISIDLSANYLAANYVNVFAVSPMGCRLNVGEKTLFELKVSGNCGPVVFTDTMTVIAREVVKDAIAGRKGSMASRILNKYKKKPVDNMARENTILHSTSSLEIHLDESQLPDGLIARTPTSVNSNNEIFDSTTRRRRLSITNDQNPEDGMNETMSMSRQSTYTGASNNDDNKSMGGDDIGPLSRATSRGSVMSSGTSMSDMSRTMGSTNMTAKGGKFGLRTLLLFRLKGEILALDAVTNLQMPSLEPSSLPLLPSQWLQNVVSQSVLPADLPFISNQPLPSNAIMPVVKAGESHLATIYEQVKEVNEMELRALTESVLKDVFSYVFDMSSTQSYVRAVVMEASVSQTGMRLKNSDNASSNTIAGGSTSFPVEGKTSSDTYYSLIHPACDDAISKPETIDTKIDDSSKLTESEITIKCQDIISDAITRSVLDIFFEMTNTRTSSN